MAPPAVELPVEPGRVGFALLVEVEVLAGLADATGFAGAAGFAAVAATGFAIGTAAAGLLEGAAGVGVGLEAAGAEWPGGKFPAGLAGVASFGLGGSFLETYLRQLSS